MIEECLDPHGVWRVPSSRGGQLTFDRLAAIRYVAPLHFLSAGIVLLAGPLLMRAWGRNCVSNWPGEADWMLTALAGLGAVGVFLPALVVRTWRVARDARRGPPLRLDASANVIEVRPCGLHIPAHDVRWSVQHDERREKGIIGVARRAQLLMVADADAGPRTFCVTVRYGRHARRDVQQMVEAYAAFTGSLASDWERGKGSRSVG